MSLVVGARPAPTHMFEADDFEEAQKLTMLYLQQPSQGGNREWQVNRKAPGDGKTRKSWHCNSHENCAVVVKLSQAGGNTWQLVITGQHAVEPKLKRRANSAMTIEQERHVKRSLNEGSNPGRILAAMTTEKEHEYKERNIDPLQMKKQKGGLQGVRMIQLAICYTMHARYVGAACDMLYDACTIRYHDIQYAIRDMRVIQERDMPVIQEQAAARMRLMWQAHQT